MLDKNGFYRWLSKLKMALKMALKILPLALKICNKQTCFKIIFSFQNARMVFFCGNHVGIMWESCGNHMGIMWVSCGDHARGISMGTPAGDPMREIPQEFSIFLKTFFSLNINVLYDLKLFINDFDEYLKQNSPP